MNASKPRVVPEAASKAAPRAAHIELAQRIVEIARQRGLRPGERLPEEQFARLCNVSRTPVRTAMRLLREQGTLAWEPASGFRLVADLAVPEAEASMPASEEDKLAEAILRDRSARRLDETVTIGALMRRYDADRKTVSNAMKILAGENFIDRAPGQSWVFRLAPDGPAALAQSYEYRLLMEPAAILTQGFMLDEPMAGVLRRGMEALLALPDSRFDAREFQRLDTRFHEMIARGSTNGFLADALVAHLRLRRMPGALGHPNVYRLRQSTHEHLQILDHLESRQFEVAADLMRVHLRLSRSQRPQAANRGAPALLGQISRPG